MSHSNLVIEAGVAIPPRKYGKGRSPGGLNYWDGVVRAMHVGDSVLVHNKKDRLRIIRAFYKAKVKHTARSLEDGKSRFWRIEDKA